jgi:hypothetical protein
MPDSMTHGGQSIEWFYYPRQGDDAVTFSIEDGVVQHTSVGSSPYPRSK